MDIKAEQYQKWHVLSLGGDFTIAELVAVRSELEKVEQQENPHVAIDMNRVTRLDSSAIGLLSNYSQRVRAKGGELAVFEAKRDILDILYLVNLEERAAIFPTRLDFEKAAKG